MEKTTRRLKKKKESRLEIDMAKNPKKETEIRHPMWIFLTMLIGLAIDNIVLSIFSLTNAIIPHIYFLTIGIIILSIAVGILFYIIFPYTPSKTIRFEKTQKLALLTWIIVIVSIALLLVSDILLTISVAI